MNESVLCLRAALQALTEFNGVTPAILIEHIQELIKVKKTLSFSCLIQSEKQTKMT